MPFVCMFKNNFIGTTLFVHIDSFIYDRNPIRSNYYFIRADI